MSRKHWQKKTFFFFFISSLKNVLLSGLDPASPLFDGKINHKVTENSGDFVDIIHTNALGKGKLEPTGHIDFYLNGGTLQPGCLTSNNGCKIIIIITSTIALVLSDARVDKKKL